MKSETPGTNGTAGESHLEHGQRNSSYTKESKIEICCFHVDIARSFALVTNWQQGTAPKKMLAVYRRRLVFALDSEYLMQDACKEQKETKSYEGKDF